jgi:hypothetical protein
VTVNLLLNWDIRPGAEQEYFEFVVREFIPQVQRLGLEPADAWFTVYGDSPQILAVIKSPDLAQLNRVLDSDDWDSLVNQLMDFVDNYKHKIVEEKPGFQM